MSVINRVFLPMVLWPSGSTARAIESASELTKSALEGETARIKHVGCLIYSEIILRILSSISEGWSPTGTLANPGRSTRVIVLQIYSSHKQCSKWLVLSSFFYSGFLSELENYVTSWRIYLSLISELRRDKPRICYIWKLGNFNWCRFQALAFSYCKFFILYFFLRNLTRV